MQEFGNIDPVGIWHNEIVEGHGRYQAAKSLGYETIPVIKLDSLTDEQRRAYGLVHNQLTMNTGFDVYNQEPINNLMKSLFQKYATHKEDKCIIKERRRRIK